MFRLAISATVWLYSVPEIGRETTPLHHAETANQPQIAVRLHYASYRGACLRTCFEHSATGPFLLPGRARRTFRMTRLARMQCIAESTLQEACAALCPHNDCKMSLTSFAAFRQRALDGTGFSPRKRATNKCCASKNKRLVSSAYPR